VHDDLSVKSTKTYTAVSTRQRYSRLGTRSPTSAKGRLQHDKNKQTTKQKKTNVSLGLVVTRFRMHMHGHHSVLSTHRRYSHATAQTRGTAQSSIKPLLLSRLRTQLPSQHGVHGSIVSKTGELSVLCVPAIDHPARIRNSRSQCPTRHTRHLLTAV
jgi:hypothetical protein